MSLKGVLLAATIGILSGLGGSTFFYAEGFSYLSEDPAVCVNCHIMREQFDSWRKGPHRAHATCNDCHLPASFLARYLAKGSNGLHHSVGFTFQPSRPDKPGARLAFVEPIRIRPVNSSILQDNCLRCHGDFVDHILPGNTGDEETVRCAKCHQSAGHGAQR